MPNSGLRITTAYGLLVSAIYTATVGGLVFTAPLAATGRQQTCMANAVWLKLHWFDFLWICLQQEGAAAA